eukprot:204828-Pyramimonas_sp.AAC.1
MGACAADGHRFSVEARKAGERREDAFLALSNQLTPHGSSAFHRNKPHAEGWIPKLAPEEERAAKWIVITSINAPTEQVEQWSTLHPEWRLVVVGDKKSPQ